MYSICAAASAAAAVLKPHLLYNHYYTFEIVHRTQYVFTLHPAQSLRCAVCTPITIKKNVKPVVLSERKV